MYIKTAVPMVRIASSDFPAGILINASDFDPKKDVLFGSEPKADPKAADPKAPEPKAEPKPKADPDVKAPGGK